MKRSTFFIAVFLVGLYACSPSFVVDSDYDSDATFGAYSSFAVKARDTNGDNPILGSQINQKRIKQALVAEMTKRGYTYKEQNADLILSFSTDTQQKQEVENANTFYGPWYWRNNNTYLRSYEQGRLVVNLIDNKTQELLWQGWAVGEIRPVKKKNKREEYVQEVVAKVMKEYEHRPSGISFRENK